MTAWCEQKTARSSGHTTIDAAQVAASELLLDTNSVGYGDLKQEKDETWTAILTLNCKVFTSRGQRYGTCIKNVTKAKGVPLTEGFLAGCLHE